MPKTFRSFSVEKYIKPGDDFIYLVSDGPGSLRRWSLRINTVSEYREHWEDALGDYLEKLRLKNSRSYQRGPNKLWTEYRIYNDDYCWLMFEEVVGSDNLGITFMYYRKPGGTGISKFMSLIALRVRRLWYTLRGDDTAIISITRAS